MKFSVINKFVQAFFRRVFLPKELNHTNFSFKKSFIQPNLLLYKGKSIHDNTILSHENFHSIETGKGNGGLMTLKLDMENSFDYIEWPFLLRILIMWGFHPNGFTGFNNAYPVCASSCSCDYSLLTILIPFRFQYNKSSISTSPKTLHLTDGSFARIIWRSLKWPLDTSIFQDQPIESWIKAILRPHNQLAIPKRDAPEFQRLVAVTLDQLWLPKNLAVHKALS